MAVHQATGMAAVSLPNGASSLPLDILPCFERFEKIYLWLDNDEAGLNNQKKLAEKLGLKRTHIVQTDGEKDANDILRQDASRIGKYISEAKTIPDRNILVFSDLMGSVLNRLQKSEFNKGVPSRRFEFFNSTIKGLRKGELTVLTGPTGSGKTSFLSQLSLDFCQQDTPTLWGSFEIKNEILATNMLMQMSGEDLVKSQAKFPYWSDRFDALPLYFMNFFGSTNIDSIVATIDYAIYKFDIQHVIIDNLQFLMGTQARGAAKFDMLDKAIETFRDLATKRDIHFTVVIHPKKVDESEDLHISSVFGSAKATQEADNVVIIQSRDNYRVIDIKKNRYNGDIGKKGLIFDKANKNFYELATSEVSDLINKKADSDLILKKRQALQEKIAAEISEHQPKQPTKKVSAAAAAVHKKSNSSSNPVSNDDGSDDDNNGGNNGSGSVGPAGSSPSSSQPESTSNHSNQPDKPTQAAYASEEEAPTTTATTTKSTKSQSSRTKNSASKIVKKEAQENVEVLKYRVAREQAAFSNQTQSEEQSIRNDSENSEGNNNETKSSQISSPDSTFNSSTSHNNKATTTTAMRSSSPKLQSKYDEWDADSFTMSDSVEQVYAKHRLIPPKDHSGSNDVERQNATESWDYGTSDIINEDISDQIFSYQIESIKPTGTYMHAANRNNKQNSFNKMEENDRNREISDEIIQQQLSKQQKK